MISTNFFEKLLTILFVNQTLSLTAPLGEDLNLTYNFNIFIKRFVIGIVFGVLTYWLVIRDLY